MPPETAIDIRQIDRQREFLALPDDSLLTIGETADALRVTTFRVHKLLQAGKLKPTARRGGGRPFLSIGDIRAYLELADRTPEPNGG